MNSRVTTSIISIFLLLTSAATLADSPAMPKDYVKSSENGQYEFRMYVPPYRSELQRTEQSGLYPDNSPDSEPLWTVDWYSFNVFPHSNGINLVRVGPWASSTSDLAVAFYAKGEQIAQYLIEDLVEDNSKLRSTVSHFFWRTAFDYDEQNNSLTIATVDGLEYVFSLLTGELIAADDFEIDDFDNLLERVRFNPQAVELASNRIKENHYYLRRLMKHSAGVIRYLPDSLKNDRDFIMNAVAANGDTYRHLPEFWQKNRAIALLAFTSPSIRLQLRDLHESIVLNDEFVYSAIGRDSKRYSGLDDDWKKDEAVLRIALNRNGGIDAYRSAHIGLRERKDVVLASIASEHRAQSRQLKRYTKIRVNADDEKESEQDILINNVSSVSYFPEKFLDDKEVVVEFDKLLLLLAEQDESKLQTLRKVTYENIREREKRRQQLTSVLEGLLVVANDSEIIKNRTVKRTWGDGLIEQFEKEGLTGLSGYWHFLDSLWDGFKLSGFDYVINHDHVNRSADYSGGGSLELLASPKYAKVLERWSAEYLATSGTKALAKKKLKSEVVVYNTFGPNDDYSSRHTNSGYSADIGRHYYEDYQQRVANGFVVPAELEEAKLISIEAAFSYSKGYKGSKVMLLTLHEDSKGIPGKALEVFLVELDSDQYDSIYTIESELNTVLVPKKTYWLVAAVPDLSSQLGWLWNGIAEWKNNTGPRLEYNSLDNEWVDESSYGQQAFRVKATVLK